ncbi:M23 family metallopeptidase, partial [Mycobacteroides abscessus]
MPRFFPLKAGSFRWGSGFGPRSGTAHLGQDFEAVDGTPIYAAQGGDVAYIGAAAGFGQWIVLDHPVVEGAGTTVYGHMWNAFATGLKQGDRVSAGQLIGYVGANGQATGPHLHFEVHPTVWRAG